jgi:hypothetical protein
LWTITFTVADVINENATVGRVFVDANVAVFVAETGSGVLLEIESAPPWKTGGGDCDFVFGSFVPHKAKYIYK